MFLKVFCFAILFITPLLLNWNDIEYVPEKHFPIQDYLLLGKFIDKPSLFPDDCRLKKDNLPRLKNIQIKTKYKHGWEFWKDFSKQNICRIDIVISDQFKQSISDFPELLERLKTKYNKCPRYWNQKCEKKNNPFLTNYHMICFWNDIITEVEESYFKPLTKNAEMFLQIYGIIGIIITLIILGTMFLFCVEHRIGI